MTGENQPGRSLTKIAPHPTGKPRVKTSRFSAIVIGSVGGGAIALTTFAMVLGRFALHAATGDEGTSAIQVTTGALYLMVLILSALGGLLIGAIGYGIGASAEPDAPRFGLRYLLPVSAVTAAVVAYAVLRIGVGGFGDIQGGLATIGVFRMAVTVLAMGVVAGGITSGIADSLARPELFFFGGEAWPSGPREVMSAMLGAVSAPLVAAVVAAGFSIPLSIVLVELGGDAATIVFSVVGAIVLGITTLAAARPWDKGTS